MSERGYPQEFPTQTISPMPGLERDMEVQPRYSADWYAGSGKLRNKVALITGGDSGIGRSVAILYAREGASVAISYLEHEQPDAEKTKQLIEKEGSKCLLLPGDIRDRGHCFNIVNRVVQEFGKLDILVNHAGVQYTHQDIREITEELLDKTFRTNVYPMFFLIQAALDQLERNKGCIINTGSVTAFKGMPILLDYSATKGAIHTFTRSLASTLAQKGIRVNSVAPGPIWTPFIPASFPAEKLKEFGKQTALGRAGQPEEVAPAYVFLASQDASYITGQTIHVNGGMIVNA